MSYSLLIFFCLCVKFIYAVKDCSSPWEKVNDNICLLLNSNIKTWNHAKISCNHYGGDLLYIDNELEKTQIDDFLNTLLRYRFNLKPFAWLDAKKKSEEWIWSHNNQSVLYSNWAANLNPNNSPQLNCACIRLRDKTWRPCDCFTKQHYICRKTDRLEETRTNLNLPLQTIKMESQVSKVASNDDLSQDEKSIIVSSLVLMNDEDARKAASSSDIQEQNDIKLLESMKTNSGFLRAPNLFINIYRSKIPKNSVVFSLQDCQFGFGYYSVDPYCSIYKICENWDDKHAIITVNKCVDGKIFNFEKFQCVAQENQLCKPNTFVRV